MDIKGNYGDIPIMDRALVCVPCQEKGELISDSHATLTLRQWYDKWERNHRPLLPLVGVGCVVCGDINSSSQMTCITRLRVKI